MGVTENTWGDVVYPTYPTISWAPPSCCQIFGYPHPSEQDIFSPWFYGFLNHFLVQILDHCLEVRSVVSIGRRLLRNFNHSFFLALFAIRGSRNDADTLLRLISNQESGILRSSPCRRRSTKNGKMSPKVSRAGWTRG